MSIKNTINADKIHAVVNKAKKAVVDFRIEKLSRFRNRTVISIGAGVLGLAVICGALAISGITNSNEEQFSTLEEEQVAGVTTTCYAIQVNSRKIAVLASMEEAQTVLDEVAAYYQTNGSEIISVSYAETVEIAEIQEEEPELMQVADAVTMIITGTKEPKTYTVVEGDNFWDISVKCGMSVDELIASNPNADPDHLKIGSVLNLYEVKPYVHLTITEQLTATENIDFNVTYEETNTLYKGEFQVKVSGEYGKREVTKEIIKENGVVVSETEVASQIVSEPKSQVTLKGTKSLSTLVGTGSFSSPMGHLEISSGYGSRGGGRHNGVDLRNPKGTSIYVVDDGVVTFSGYKGSFGNLVRVSHGNGIETWYAHCDSLLVSIGDVVRKGDKIATVGMTGRATGYHLHFEVRKNGVPQNPMNYL